ncbi:hypothetical protein C8Q72DRAFT_884709 [Fomitopsis betulina]|nr:hypothetical protein C8Q72DRAFT_884709 [Fomitopsis betulina]
MKAQFSMEFPPQLRDVIEHTWLVNHWGKAGRSIPMDLYLEHNNGFLKNMFAATGSNASMVNIQNKSSACIEVLQNLSTDVTTYFNVCDHHRSHREVNVEADLQALLVDMKEQKIHTFITDWCMPPPHAK